MKVRGQITSRFCFLFLLLYLADLEIEHQMMEVVCVSKIWALTSFVSSIVCAVGYYFPYWLEGHHVTENGDLVPMYFGVFRRCSYPQVTENGGIEVVDTCGRYSAFMDIPSLFWQVIFRCQ